MMDYGDARLPGRFWDKVFPEPNTGCWLWAGDSHQFGYGLFLVQGKRVRAHRLTLAASTGSDGEGLFALHSCDAPPCVNPTHLRWGTPKENTHDAVSRGRMRAWNGEKTHCIRDHEFTADNTHLDTNGKRQCRVCQRARGERQRQRHPERAREYQRAYRDRRKAEQ